MRLPVAFAARNTGGLRMRRAERRSVERHVALGALLVLVICGWNYPVDAHGIRLAFVNWGGFPPAAVRCQRVIAYAVAQCAAQVWVQQRACERAKLTGQRCDQSALGAATAAIVVSAQDTIGANCLTEVQDAQLGYLSQFDIDTDVGNFCRAWSPGTPLSAPSWPAAAVSAVYGPLQGLAAPTAEQVACSDAAADAASAAMQLAFRTRRQCMDRIAAESLDTPNRSGLLDDATAHLNAAYPVLAARLQARCGTAAFTALYGRSPEAFIAGLGTRADCIGGQFYIQDAVLCPNAICGNGIVEPGEDCDDGNTNDGDTCPSTCVFS
jgi:cysteine-rich repeat protein